MARFDPSRLLVPVLVSKLGNQFLIAAIPLALYDLTKSASDAVLSFAVGALPWLASTFIGAVIDRFDRRRVFLVSESLQAAAVIALALTITSAPLLITYLLFLITSTGAVTSSIVVNFLLLPELAPTGRLARLNGMFTAASQLVALLGLPLGGLIYGTLGARPVLLLDAASFALSIGVCVLLPPAEPRTAQHRSAWTTVTQGWAYLGHRRDLLGLALVLGVCNLGSGSLAVVILQVGRRSWHWNATAASAAMAVGSAGAAAGAFIAGRRPHERLDNAVTRRRITAGLAVLVAGAAVMAVLTFTPVLLVGYLLLAVGEGIVNVESVLMRQLLIPRELAGRVNAAIRLIILGAIPLSAVLQAWLIRFGPRMPLTACLALAVLALIGWAVRPEPDDRPNRAGAEPTELTRAREN